MRFYPVCMPEVVAEVELREPEGDGEACEEGGEVRGAEEGYREVGTGGGC